MFVKVVIALWLFLCLFMLLLVSIVSIVSVPSAKAKLTFAKFSMNLCPAGAVLERDRPVSFPYCYAGTCNFVYVFIKVPGPVHKDLVPCCAERVLCSNVSDQWVSHSCYAIKSGQTPRKCLPSSSTTQRGHKHSSFYFVICLFKLILNLGQESWMSCSLSKKNTCQA